MTDSVFKNWIKLTITTTAICTVIISVVLFICFSVDKSNCRKTYNNGVCPKDGTNWNYFGCDYHNPMSKYYICDNKHIIKLVGNYD